MRHYVNAGRSLLLLTAVVFSLSGCLGDNCRPHRGWSDRGGDHDCGRHHDRDYR
jgi:hypothetical protein